MRNLVLGQDDRPATKAELAAMEAAVAQAMEEGALGLSTSLIYVPGRFASTEEIVALARVAARYGGSYATHQRDEEDGIDASLDEVFRIAREAKIPAEIYHLKTAGRPNWGRMPAVLKRIEAVRAEGLDVSADQYPWSASSNNLDADLPAWVREGGHDKMVARLLDPPTRARARQDLAQGLLQKFPDWNEGGSAAILVTSVLNPALKKYEGMTLAAIAKAESKDPLDVLIDLVVADRGATDRVTFSMGEDDVRTALKHPFVAFCTDSAARAEDGIFSEEKSHPRAWGSAPRILGHYVREEKLLSLEEAVRKMTSLPASRMRLADRGIVRPGFAADLVVFDPRTIRSARPTPTRSTTARASPTWPSTASSWWTGARSPPPAPASSCAGRGTSRSLKPTADARNPTRRPPSFTSGNRACSRDFFGPGTACPGAKLGSTRARSAFARPWRRPPCP